MLNQLERFNQLSLFEKSRLLQAWATYPALTILVIWRSDVGSRLVTAPGTAVVFLLMLLIAAVCPPHSRPVFLAGYTGFFLLGCLFQRFKRWREFRKGVRQHSYSIGSTGFNPWLLRFVPNFVLRHRLIERFIEPPLFGYLGWLCCTYLSTALGGWLIFAAICFFITEASVTERERERQMDMVDGLVASEVQSETVERFSPPADSHAAHSDDVIRTGVSDDIAGAIARRKQRRPKS